MGTDNIPSPKFFKSSHFKRNGRNGICNTDLRLKHRNTFGDYLTEESASPVASANGR
jgi:hypothetical protein